MLDTMHAMHTTKNTKLMVKLSSNSNALLSIATSMYENSYGPNYEIPCFRMEGSNKEGNENGNI